MRRDIDPETIAALLEGKIAGEERAQLLSALAASPEMAELFAEAAAVHAELQSPEDVSSADTRVLRLRPRFWTLGSLAFAAAIAALIIIPRIDESGGGIPLTLRSDATWLNTPPGNLTVSLGESWSEPLWQVTRGAGAGDARAFRTGVRLVDLDVAWMAEQGDVVRRLAASLRTLHEAAPEGSVAGALFDRIAQSETLQADARADAMAATAAVMGDDLGFQLGLWIEQARLAARAGDTAFFRAGRSPHDALRALIERTDGRAPAEVTGDLVRIEGIIASGNASQRLADILGLLEAVLRVAGDA